MAQTGVPRVIKQAIDRAVAAALLLLTFPILLGAALAVRINMGAPVLFVQDRPGLHGRPFRLYKLRTMLKDAGPDDRSGPDAMRITPLGKFLRASSIDELPQLWNVLLGKISLVGPRPLLTRYLPLYSSEQARRHDVLPGITGWAQVNGRNAISWEERFSLDVWYVDHWSLALDLRILAMTIPIVIRREGISQAGHATIAEFTGAGATRDDR